jgi:hypothetical protein
MTDKFDIIGDIHGHADALRRLLDVLGYREIETGFQYPDRRAIFMGDFVDRGPEQRAVLQIAKSMCDAGSAFAVMGTRPITMVIMPSDFAFDTCEVTQRRAGFPAAIEAIKRALELDRDYVLGYNTLAMTQKLMGAYEKSAHNYEEGLKALARLTAKSLLNAEHSPRVPHRRSRGDL